MKVKLYNCFCNEILVSTSLLYLLWFHVLKVEKNHYECEKESQISEFPFSMYLYSSLLPPLCQNTKPQRESLGHLLFLGKAQESYRINPNMAVQQSSVPLPEQLWFSSQWRRPQVLSSTNQEVLGGPSAGGQLQNRRYFTNEEHNLCRHQKRPAKDGHGYLPDTV